METLKPPERGRVVLTRVIHDASISRAGGSPAAARTDAAGGTLRRSRIALAGQRLRHQLKASPRRADAANARGGRQDNRPGAGGRGGEHRDEHAIVTDTPRHGHLLELLPEE